MIEQDNKRERKERRIEVDGEKKENMERRKEVRRGKERKKEKKVEKVVGGRKICVEIK